MTAHRDAVTDVACADAPLNRLIRMAYEAPIEPEPWRAFVQELRRALDATTSSLMFRLSERGRAGHAIVDPPEAWLNDFNDISYECSAPIRELFNDMEPGEVVALSERSGSEALRKGAFYTQIMSRLGLEDALLLSVGEPGQWRAMVIMGRSAPGFSPDAVDTLRALAGPLTQALHLFAHIQSLEAQRASAEQALDALSIGIIVLDRKKRVLRTNAMARRIVQGTDALRFSGGTLAFARTEHGQLLDAFAPPSTTDPVHNMTAIRLTNRDDVPISVLFRPIDGETGIEPGAPGLVVYLTQHSAHMTLRRQILMTVFDLTPSEAAVTAQLVDGLTPRDAAASLGLTENSVRTYCKSIYEKVGVNRQVDLVKMVLGSVAALAPAD